MSTEANGPPAWMATQELAEYLTALESEHDTLKAQSALCGSELRQLRAQLALCRSVIEEARPMVKAHLLEMERFGPGDESIVGRIEQALKVGAA